MSDDISHDHAQNRLATKTALNTLKLIGCINCLAENMTNQYVHFLNPGGGIVGDHNIQVA